MFYSTIGTDAISNFASTTAMEAQNSAREAQTNLELLKNDVDRLLLITEAMWMLMKEKEGYTDDVLVKLVEEIDKRKVIVNGVEVKAPIKCSACGKTNSAKRLVCIYCGASLQARLFAR